MDGYFDVLARAKALLAAHADDSEPAINPSPEVTESKQPEPPKQSIGTISKIQAAVAGLE